MNERSWMSVLCEVLFKGPGRHCIAYEFTLLSHEPTMRLGGSQLWLIVPVQKGAANET